MVSPSDPPRVKEVLNMSSVLGKLVKDKERCGVTEKLNITLEALTSPFVAIVAASDSSMNMVVIYSEFTHTRT